MAPLTRGDSWGVHHAAAYSGRENARPVQLVNAASTKAMSKPGFSGHVDQARSAACVSSSTMESGVSPGR